VKKSSLLLVVAAISAAACGGDSSLSAAPKSAQAATPSESRAEQDFNWGPAPDFLPKGAQIAVLQGNPGGNEEFTVRLKFPAGYKIAPHTHPTIENVTVLQGTFLAGMGEEFAKSALHPFGRDGFVSIPANHAHYAMARGETIIQLHAVGPFLVTYINPNDDPRNR